MRSPTGADWYIWHMPFTHMFFEEKCMSKQAYLGFCKFSAEHNSQNAYFRCKRRVEVKKRTAP